MNSMIDYRIRVATIEDAELVAGFAEAVFRETFVQYNAASDMDLYVENAFSVRREREILLDPAAHTILCFDGEELAGYLELWQSKPPLCIEPEGALEIRRYYVGAPWQGRGAAPALLKALSAYALQCETKTLWLGVWEHNARAVSYYRKIGFRKVGTLAFMLGSDQQTDDLMACPFADLVT